jgi:hypothetical protein
MARKPIGLSIPYRKVKPVKEVVIKSPNKEPITIVVYAAELEIANKQGLSDRQYIEAKVKLALEEYKAKHAEKK